MTAPQPEPTRQRVALVVFADVTECADVLDAATVAAYFLRQNIKFGPTEHPVPMRNGIPVVRFHQAMEVGMAAGNGYLWTEATSKAYRQMTWQFEGVAE